MEILDLGKKSYSEVWELQKKLVQQKIENPNSPDVLVLVEHDPVYTLGRADKSEKKESFISVPKLGKVPTVDIERGGKLTYHGPGQLVGYPIFSIRHRDLRRWLRDLEKVLIQVVSEQTLLNVKPCPESLLLEPGQLQTGVWLGDKKLASIGIAVKHWISYHGFSLNIATDLRYFEAVEPCGFAGSVMTTLKKELHTQLSTENLMNLTNTIKSALIKAFSELSKTYQASESSNKESSVTPENTVN